MRAQPTSNRLNRPLGAALALAAAFAVAMPAAAQLYDPATDTYAGPYVDELVITGPLGPDGPLRLSRAVSFADLDLVNREDQRLLRLRVRDTARDLCRALGEDFSGPSPLHPSCQDQAIRDARPQVRLAIEQAYTRVASLDARDRYPY